MFCHYVNTTKNNFQNTKTFKLLQLMELPYLQKVYTLLTFFIGGSTKIVITVDPATESFIINVRDAYKFSSLSNITSFYVVDHEDINTHEYCAIKANMLTCGSNNTLGDPGEVAVVGTVRAVYASLRRKLSGEGPLDLMQLLHYNCPKDVEKLIVNGHIFSQAKLRLSYCPRTASILRATKHDCNKNCKTGPTYDISNIDSLPLRIRGNVKDLLMRAFPLHYNDPAKIFELHSEAISDSIKL